MEFKHYLKLSKPSTATATATMISISALMTRKSSAAAEKKTDRLVEEINEAAAPARVCVVECLKKCVGPYLPTNAPTTVAAATLSVHVLDQVGRSPKGTGCSVLDLDK